MSNVHWCPKGCLGASLRPLSPSSCDETLSKSPSLSASLSVKWGHLWPSLLGGLLLRRGGAALKSWWPSGGGGWGMAISSQVSALVPLYEATSAGPKAQPRQAGISGGSAWPLGNWPSRSPCNMSLCTAQAFRFLPVPPRPVTCLSGLERVTPFSPQAQSREKANAGEPFSEWLLSWRGAEGGAGGADMTGHVRAERCCAGGLLSPHPHILQIKPSSFPLPPDKTSSAPPPSPASQEDAVIPAHPHPHHEAGS